jgi:hypothetical protein
VAGRVPAHAKGAIPAAIKVIAASERYTRAEGGAYLNKVQLVPVIHNADVVGFVVGFFSSQESFNGLVAYPALTVV